MVVLMPSQTTRLGNAYGVCVILVTFITTNLVTLVALIVWRKHPLLVFVVWLPFVALDGLFLSAAMVKVPDGAWFTLLLAGILASFFSLWRYGKEKQWKAETKETVNLCDVVVSFADCSTPNNYMSSRRELNRKDNQLYLKLPRYSGAELTPIHGFGIFFDKAGSDALVPQVYENFITTFEAHLDVVVFLHLRPLGVPHVHEEDRYTVVKTTVKDVYRLTIRHGYNDRVVTPNLGHLVYEEVRKAIIKGTVGSHPRLHGSEKAVTTSIVQGETGVSTVTTFATPDPEGEGKEIPSSPTSASAARSASTRLKALDEAYENQTLYLVGKEQLRITKRKGLGGAFQRVILALFLFVRDNTRQKVAQLDVPVEKLVEVGFVGLI